jgi:cytochrome P450
VITYDGDLLSPHVLADPYPELARLRQAGPIVWSSRWHGWYTADYAVAASITRDVDKFSSERFANFARSTASDGTQTLADSYPSYRLLAKWLSFIDPPEHTRVRKLVRDAFSPRAMRSLQAFVDSTARELVASLRHGVEVDLLATFAYPFPLRVVSHMLGIGEDKAVAVKVWSDAIMPVILGGAGDVDRHRNADHALSEMAGLFGELIAERRSRPGPDMISGLLAASDGDSVLTDDEITATCMITLFGGHETSTDLLLNAVRALSAAPEKAAELRAAPAQAMSGAVEEFLRFDSPTKGYVRWVRERVEVAGESLTPGERVLIFISGANRDPARFPQPDVLDFTRSPNPHLTFGVGIHHCIGAGLARMEAAAGLRALLDRFTSFHIARQDLEWHRTLMSRSLERLPVVFT